MAFYRRNIGGVQQMLRVAIGAGALIVAALSLSGLLAWVIGAGGVLFACTGFVGYCPMCAIAGMTGSRS